jgi:hypothetical protein
MAVSFSDLQLAFEFVSSGGMGENEAYIDRQSGKIYWHSEVGDNDEELPDDIDDGKYVSIPTRESSILGSLWPWISLVSSSPTTTTKFAKSSAGELLVRRGALERWYDFSNNFKETALREWCAENGIELSET